MALGLAHMGKGDIAASRSFHFESLALARERRHDRDIALTLANLADLAFVSGDHEETDTLARESLELSRRMGDEEAAGVALLELGASALEQGRDAEAVPMIVESVGCFRSVDFKDFLASSLVALARVCVSDEPAHAARVLGAARTLRAPLGPAQFPWEEAWFETTLERLREALGTTAADAEIDAGAAQPDVTIAEALARSA
jgi:hypothetical protein